MRIHIAIIIAASLLSLEAQASSILVVEDNPATTSRSVMVIEEGAGVSEERVASIVTNSTPAVLRGGVYGEALPAPVAEAELVEKLSRPALRKKERAERRAIREASRFGEPLPEKPETDQKTGG